MKVSGNPTHNDDLQVFNDEHKHMDELVETSTLQTLRVDISDNDVPGTVERIADWLEASG